jgi:hypothetical protein
MQVQLQRMYDFENLLKDWLTYDSVVFSVRSRQVSLYDDIDCHPFIADQWFLVVHQFMKLTLLQN